MHTSLSKLTLASLAATALASAAGASTIFDTGTPDGGFFGFIGYDVFDGQSVAVAFTPDHACTLDDIGVWMMSNDFDNPGRTFTLSLQTDSLNGANPAAPSGTVLETWDMATAAVGWNPVLDVANSVLHPLLSAGTTYWVVAESTEQGGADPVWVWGSTFDGVYSGNIDFFSSPDWQTGETFGSAPGVVINATDVPAPASLALLGIAGFVGRRRRR
ncbi:MAG TPA: PEP-CTERM sorting domain-containing protein [Phycisphaerales bacterium]|nr:PEP-CTERM sorting domain-containing protein [Phycisphaerales bacterium]